MKIKGRVASLLMVGLMAGITMAGCDSGGGATPTSVSGGSGPATSCSTPDKVKLQLKWLHQAQFAGYYVAADKGYYKERCLDVELLPGGPDVVPSQKVNTGAADIGIDWVGSLLANRDKGQPLVDVGQFYQSSGLYLISKKSSNINSPKDLKGKKVGVWTGGNEFEFRALMDKYGFDNSIDNNKDMTIIKQGFEMASFIDGQLDAASATVYNEYPVVLEAGLKPEEINIISYNAEGVGMLEDHVFVTEQTMKDKKDILVRFLAAAQKGWQTAVTDQAAAVDSVMSRADASTTDKNHQVTMMKEVAKLVMPEGLAADKVGFIDPAKFDTTAGIALKFNVISKPASNAYTNDLMDAAAKLNAAK
ncbi:MAG: ABC transporter substrate-binding protein [Chloroflexota bacterium]